jgi:MazG family protein
MIEYTYADASDFDGALHNLYEIVTLLRSPGGCPWDREQHCKDVVRALQDECYEYLAALQADDTAECREEIGDVLMNLFLLLRIHEEQKDFLPVEAVNEICRKLIRRHPHVFSTESVADSTEVLTLWNKIKEDVEGRKASDDDFFSRVPKSLPPVEEAWEIQKKVRKVGFDWQDTQGVIDKVCEELDEVLEALNTVEPDQERIEEEVGDLLFSVINLSRTLKVSPGNALHRSNRKFRARFNLLAEKCKERGIELKKENFSSMDEIWDEVKREERISR